MGCDIHGFCEVKENGVWRLNTEKVFKNPYYLSDEELEKRKADNPDYEKGEWQEDEFEAHPDTGRNYDWFSILADVRNGRGFAGVKTGDGFDVIAQPRGVPKNATPEWMAEVDQWRDDMHSHSFLSVEDFDLFDWDQTTYKSGVITLDEYKQLKPTNASPESWSGWVSGPDLVVLNEDEADMVIEGKTVVHKQRDPFGRQGDGTLVSLDSGHNINVSYDWPVEYRQWFEYKIQNVVEPMRKLKEKYEDVRYVFGFDN